MHKIIFAGTPEFAVPALRALAQSDHRLLAVYTQPDRPAGRGRKLQASAVKACAQSFDLPVLQPENLKSSTALEQLKDFNADLMVVAAYGLILPVAALASPALACINIHASLLPRWRGASPIQQAIIEGDQKTGVTLMKMSQGLDTGPMIAQNECLIGESCTAAELQSSLADLGADLLIKSLPEIQRLLQQATEQDESAACYAPRIVKQQAEIDWRKSVARLNREIRGYSPWPVSYTSFEGDNLRLWQAEVCSDQDSLIENSKQPGEVLQHSPQGLFVAAVDGVLKITELQFSGRKKCNAAEALNARDLTGCKLGVK